MHFYQLLLLETLLSHVHHSINHSALMFAAAVTSVMKLYVTAWVVIALQ